MRKRINMIPAILMLAASAITSIICYILNYEVMSMLLILLFVMFVFYMLGDVIRFFLIRHVCPPEEDKEDETDANGLDEGAVIEKEPAEDEE